jgi:hypothetical protein
MSKKTVVSVFSRREEAEAAAERLGAHGIDRSDLSVRAEVDADEHAGRLASSDFAAPILPGRGVYPAVPVAGAAGPVLDLPGTDAPAGEVGQTSAASDRAAAAEAADVTSWLVGEGVDEKDAEGYAAHVRGGGAILLARCDEAEVATVVRVLQERGSPASGRRPV